jgi:hypothetical protein
VAVSHSKFWDLLKLYKFIEISWFDHNIYHVWKVWCSGFDKGW